MDIPAYLERINYPGSVKPDTETLRKLHRAHMLAVPFENLDILPLHRPIRLDEASLWEKIVVGGRGGFCYELNGLFAALLREIGFEVTYLNARVFDDEGNLGIDFDHLALLVQAPREPVRWLADVGFGDSFTEPLDFDSRLEQAQHGRAYQLAEMGKSHGGYVVSQRDYQGRWAQLYCFDLQPCKFPGDYEAACQYHQTSPESSFTRGSIMSRATPEGRISLEDNWLILTQHGQREKRELKEGEHAALLKEYFGVVLGP